MNTVTKLLTPTTFVFLGALPMMLSVKDCERKKQRTHDAGPDPRRRAGSRLGGQERAQDDAEQKPVRIHAGALVAVSAVRIPPRATTLPSVFQIIPTTAERTHGRHSRAQDDRFPFW